MDDLVLSRSGWAGIDPVVGYTLLRLRCDVFVVEQQCAYPELDGRDTEPGTDHRWVHRADDPADVRAYLRVLQEQGQSRVGRIVTAASSRGRGLAGRLVADVVADQGGNDIVLAAQSHLSGWYARYGFDVDGDDFVEDGIPHTPMRRPAGG